MWLITIENRRNFKTDFYRIVGENPRFMQDILCRISNRDDMLRITYSDHNILMPNSRFDLASLSLE